MAFPESPQICPTPLTTQVERNSWSRQYIWATSVLPTLFGTRRLVALRAIQTGLYRQYCPVFEKEENNRKK